VQLPATRELAKQYAVSRGTAVMAFEQLHAEGYLEGRTGDGTYVNRQLPEDLLAAPRAAIAAASISGRTARVSQLARRLPPAPPGGGPPRAFRPEPLIDEFPIATWAEIAGRCMRRASRRMLADNDSRGYRPLREAVANYLGEARRHLYRR
jgi:GntR family transcriptional regulator/MocR family aminotransferase